MNYKKMELKYNYPAPIDNEFARKATGSNSWEKYSLPLGNGYFGANFFGRHETERIQISEPTLVNPWYTVENNDYIGCPAAGVNSFLEILVNINHKNVTNYERSLSLEHACYNMEYDYEGTHYKMTAFTSYPDKVLVVRFEANKENKINIDINAFIPFLGEYTKEEGDNFSKSGNITIKDDMFIIEGLMGYYNIEYFGVLKVIQVGGELSSNQDFIKISNANNVELIFNCKTNYQLSEKVFLENNPKDKIKGLVINKEEVYEIINEASKFSFLELMGRHISDYYKLYSRVSVNIYEDDNNKYTHELLSDYKKGIKSSYLETLLFQYGRYLLISSSRTFMPAHLQGIWNPYCDSPWSCGYWHNINIQMNYWLTGPTNLNELFLPFINYTKAYMKKAKWYADNYIKNNYPLNYEEGNNGWIVNTGCSAFYIEGFERVCHSGPGTGGFTALMFWDYYDYSQDKEFLKDFGFKALYEMSLFYSKILICENGVYLVKDSASPENEHNGSYYKTKGCTFDQQMVYETFKRTIDAAKVLEYEDDLILKIKHILPRLEPVLIGDSGQLKEYREETTYSSIGDPIHRHISHLVGLYPGTIITSKNPSWIEAAKVALLHRGNEIYYSYGWSYILRMLMWIRIKDFGQTEELIRLVIDNLFDNLWSNAPPFQIDANFGFTTAMAEMLIQSHGEFIEILPCILPRWCSGEFKGLVARGNFVIDCKWENHTIKYLKVLSNTDNLLNIKLPENLNSGSTLIYSKQMKKGEILVFE